LLFRFSNEKAKNRAFRGYGHAYGMAAPHPYNPVARIQEPASKQET
jgi:hypothetical protein